MRSDLPAAAGFAMANVAWKLIVMRFPIGKSCERFDERAERDGLGGVLPVGREKSARAGIEKEIGDVAAGKLAFENENGGLAKKRLRRCGRVLARIRRRVGMSGKTRCHRESHDDQTDG